MKDFNKHTVAVLLFNSEGKVLGVSRKDDHSKFGLIGGKVDEDDISLELAAIRECKEETGLDIFNLKKVFSYKNEEKDKVGTTFMAEYKGYIHKTSEKETGVVKWITFDELKSGPFGKYNSALEEHLKAKGII